MDADNISTLVFNDLSNGGTLVVEILEHDKLFSLEDTLQNFLAIATTELNHTHGPRAAYRYRLMIYLQLNCNTIYQQYTFNISGIDPNGFNTNKSIESNTSKICAPSHFISKD